MPAISSSDATWMKSRPVQNAIIISERTRYHDSSWEPNPPHFGIPPLTIIDIYAFSSINSSVYNYPGYILTPDMLNSFSFALNDR